MKKIKLTQGQFAIVDDDIYEELNQYKWHARKGRSTFYAGRSISAQGKQILIQMHRQILGLTDSKIFCDHINNNGLCNLKYNLRVCTISDNNKNTKPHIGYTSKYKGVNFHKKSKKWVVQIQIDEKRTHLGLFTNEIEAAKKYDEAAIEHYGEFANLNFK